jgi:phosphatidylglycerol:prolipoprotein diacylglycerol transferase
MLDAALPFAVGLQFPELNPIAWDFGTLNLFGMTIGPLQLRWYALAYIAGLLLGWLYIQRLVKKEALWAPGAPPMKPADADDLLFWATLGVILGGRLGYVIFYMLPDPASAARIAADPSVIIRIWDGGMAFHGGLIGVALALWWFARSRKASLFSIGDAAAAATPIGLFFGRLANFVNGELYGRETNLPWGMVFCNDTIRAANGGLCPAGLEPRHPSQLYEAALEGLVLFFVLRLATHRFKTLGKPGMTAGIFLVGYGLVRASLEMVRNPDAHMPDALRGYVTMGLLLSIPMIAIGAWLIARAQKTAAAPAT